jgi:hypothetical protein
MKIRKFQTGTVLTIALLMSVSLSAFSQDRNMSAAEALIWVEENKEEVLQKSRADILALNDVTLQLVAFAKLPQTQRHAFKVEHLGEVLTLDWNEEEQEHLMKLYNLIARNPSLLECDNAATLENLLLSWVTRGYELFGWGMYTSLAIITPSVRMQDKAGNPNIIHATIEFVFAFSSAVDCES